MKEKFYKFLGDNQTDIDNIETVTLVIYGAAHRKVVLYDIAKDTNSFASPVSFLANRDTFDKWLDFVSRHFRLSEKLSWQFDIFLKNGNFIYTGNLLVPPN